MQIHVVDMVHNYCNDAWCICNAGEQDVSLYQDILTCSYSMDIENDEDHFKQDANRADDDISEGVNASTGSKHHFQLRLWCQGAQHDDPEEDNQLQYSSDVVVPHAQFFNARNVALCCHLS